jgi:hypothetical protein
MFSKKATKIDEIFTFDLTLCSKRQIDFVNFRGLLRKYELYPHSVSAARIKSNDLMGDFFCNNYLGVFLTQHIGALLAQPFNVFLIFYFRPTNQPISAVWYLGILLSIAQFWSVVHTMQT